ncbi:uncharacterized protein LOC117169824 [Belonocnema kinseyi]|uniref:uncharacterized protein LOC117169824 n=1 Tax=Belonocnema kinseyi TaxID=2817044 RepID=UPI00143D5997|nr:uncharacterized protein LOC117169824 [Belonocnema kinseyi]
MAATVYSRVNSITSQTCTRLLVAKTKLSPIRSLRPPATKAPRMTIPHLELRAALLAAQLLRSLASELDISTENCIAWIDSQIVLHWLRSTKPTGNVLIDNYIEHVQELLPASIWHYVPTESNPEDLASRCVEPQQLLSCKLWWTGLD